MSASHNTTSHNSSSTGGGAMDKAKAAVSGFLHKSGHNDTTVHETVNPHVTHETVKPTHHEDVQTAVDREVHQDHYHTTVQPVKDQQVLPEQHSHNVVGVEHRKFEHDDASKVKANLDREAAKFRDERVTHDTRSTASAQPVVGGEHTHHHVHENIQPVVERETIQPSVVHTTVPVHEVHHNAAQHHTASALPTMSMNEFQQAGGALGGRQERTDHFPGEPKLKNLAEGTIGSTGTHGTHHNSTHGTTGTTGTTSTSGLPGTHSTTGTHGTHGTAGTTSGSSLDPRTNQTTNTTSGTNHSKPGLMDKLNPKKDADHDGKAGLMD